MLSDFCVFYNREDIVKRHTSVWFLCLLIPNGLTDLLRFKRHSQPQFGHPVLFQQLEVRAQCQAEGPGDPLHQPIVFGGVTCTSFGVIAPLQEEDLHRAKVVVRVKIGGRWTSDDVLSASPYFCPADDLPILFVFRLLEHLCAADGLHGLPIDGTDNSVWQKTNLH